MKSVDIVHPKRILEAKDHAEKEIDAVPVPYEAWKNACRDEGGQVGMAKGWYVILGGNPGHGKSLTALNIAAHAWRCRVGVGIIPLEMSLPQLRTRTFAILSGEKVWKLEPGKYYDPEAMQRALMAVGEAWELKRVPFEVIGAPDPSLAGICSALDHLFGTGCSLIIVDYLQLIRTRHARLHASVSDISSAIRHWTRTRPAVVLALSQFNRETSGNYDESPQPQGLIGSSQLESDADQILLIDHSRYRRERVTKGTEDIPMAKTFLMLTKNRHGTLADIPVAMNFQNLRMREGMPDELTEWPTHKKRKG